MPEIPDPNAPVTRADIAATETRILDRVEQILRDFKTHILEATQEQVRDAQTEILRAFHAYSSGVNITLRKLKADVTNIDAATDQRIAIVEGRLREIEMRLLLKPPA